MAFPVVAATNTSETNPTSTTHVVNLPASIAAGDLLIIVVAAGIGNTAGTGVTITPAAGWTELFDDNATAGGAAWCAYKIASGSEGATVSVTSSATSLSVHCSYRINSWHGTTPPEATVLGAGGSTSLDPPSQTASWGSDDNLWIALATWKNATSAFSAYPTNYTSNQVALNNSHAGSSDGALAIATRNVTTATEDPGAFTLLASSSSHNATIVVRPAATTTVIATVSPRPIIWRLRRKSRRSTTPFNKVSPSYAPPVSGPSPTTNIGRLIWPLRNKLRNPAFVWLKNRTIRNYPWNAVSPRFPDFLTVPGVVHPYIPLPVNAGRNSDFAGTAALLFGQSGDLKANALTAGTTALTFGQSGDLKANAAAAGTSALTFGQSAALTANALAAGTSTLTFGQSGALTANALAAGTSALTFGQTGALTANSVHAGTSALTFSQTGALAATGSLSATTTVTFAQSGALAAQTALASTSALVFSQTGDFVSIGGDVAFTGTISFIFGQSGTFTSVSATTRRQGGIWDFTESDKAERERHRKEKQSQDDLRRIVENAFRKAEGEDDAAPVVQSKAQRKAIAKSVLADLRLDGFDTTLEQIQRLIRDYERLRQQAIAKAMEEEAIVMLLIM